MPFFLSSEFFSLQETGQEVNSSKASEVRKRWELMFVQNKGRSPKE